MTLDSVLTDLGKLYVLAAPHWPFFAYTALFAFVGEVMKRQVITPTNTVKLEKHADIWWNRKGFGYVIAVIILTWTRVPLALHPLAAGFVLGSIPGIPVSKGVHYGAQSVIYCVSAGMASTALYSTLRAVWGFVWTYVLRKTEPVPNIQLPGEPSMVPPEPTPETEVKP